MPSFREIFTGEKLAWPDRIRDLVIELHREDDLCLAMFGEDRIFATEVPFPIKSKGYPQVGWLVESNTKIGGTGNCDKRDLALSQIVAWESPMRALDPNEAGVASYLDHSEAILNNFVDDNAVGAGRDVRRFHKIKDFGATDLGAAELERGWVVYVTAQVVLEVHVDRFTRQLI